MKEELRIRIRLRLAAAGLRRAGREAEVVRHGESVSPLRPDRVPTSKKIGSKNGATGRSDIEGKVTRVGASEPGGDRVSIKKGREIKLTASEYTLLLLFVRHPGRVLTHRHILREIWGPKSEEHRQYLRVYVTLLRQKIESDPASPSLIKT